MSMMGKHPIYLIPMLLFYAMPVRAKAVKFVTQRLHNAILNISNKLMPNKYIHVSHSPFINLEAVSLMPASNQCGRVAKVGLFDSVLLAWFIKGGPF